MGAYLLRSLRAYPLQRVSLPPYLLGIRLWPAVGAGLVDAAIVRLVLVAKEVRGVGALRKGDGDVSKDSSLIQAAQRD
jgi:hypothetical protein